MASVQFQIHTDKENATSAGIKTIPGRVQGGKAKSFQPHKTPRRALGSVNEANRVDRRTQPPQDLKSGIPSTGLKQKNTVEKDTGRLKQRQQQDKENVVKRGKQQEEKGGAHLLLKAKQQQTSVSYCLPDIEYMPPPSPPRDEDEDILPMKKRTSTYVHKLLSWWPSCFFGTVPDSEEEEDDEKEHQRVMDELDKLPLPNDDASLHLSREDLDVDTIQLPSMEDVPLPSVDDAQQDCSADTEQPMLDDSLGLVPHLGNLEFLDQSLPSISE